MRNLVVHERMQPVVPVIEATVLILDALNEIQSFAVQCLSATFSFLSRTQVSSPGRSAC